MNLMNAVLETLKHGIENALTNKEIYKKQMIANHLLESADDKSRSASINKAINRLKDAGEIIHGNGDAGWYL